MHAVKPERTYEMAKSMLTSLSALGKSVSDGLDLLAMALNPKAMHMASNIHKPSPPINYEYRQQAKRTR